MGKRGLLIVAASLTVLIGLAALRSSRKDAAETRPVSSSRDSTRRQLKTFWSAFDQAAEKRIREEWSQAVDLYQQTLRLNPRHEESLYYLGNCYFELGEYDQAARVYQRLLQINPKSNRGHAQMGLLRSSPWPGAPVDFEQAEQSLRESVRLYPEESGGFIRLGRLALARGRQEEARTYFDQAAGFRSAEGLFWAGYVRFRQGHYREAALRFGRVLDQERREKRLAGKGIAAEGDTAPRGSDAAGSARGRQSPPDYLGSAALRSRYFLYLAEKKLGARPPAAPEEFKPRPPAPPPRLVAAFPELPGLEVRQSGRGAWADYDGDGDADLALVESGAGPALFRNHAGALRREVSLEVPAGEAWDLLWGDFDSDGRPDLYLVAPGFTGLGQNRLLRQTGSDDSVSFQDATHDWGLGGMRATAKAIFLDYDGDGRLDLLEAGNARPGVPALRLFRNEPGNTFRECGLQAGLGFSGNAVDVASDDFDGDGLPDLLVLRWKQSPLLYRNLGNGRFSDLSGAAGLPARAWTGFSALFTDFDRDGRPDLLLTHYPAAERPIQALLGQSERGGSFLLLRNLDGKAFGEATVEAGLDLSFSVLQVVEADLDGDGWPDLIAANGSLDRSRLESSVILRNQGGRFLVWDYLPALDDPVESSGAAVADADGGQSAHIYLAGAGLFRIK